MSSFSVIASKTLFTPEEQHWLDKQQSISIAVMQNWPPISMLDDDGKPIGIDADIVQAINTRIGNKLHIVSGSWNDIYYQAKNKQFDAIMGITPNQFRKPFFNFTTPYLKVPHVIVSRKNDPTFYRSEIDLSGKTIALEKDFVNISYFKKNYPEVIIKTYKDTLEALEAVSRGEADTYAGSRVVVLYLIEKQLLSNLKINGKLNKQATALAIGSSKDEPLLSSILQKSLNDIGKGQLRFIINKWIYKHSDINLNTIQLSSAEQQWIAQHKEITIGIDGNWPPIDFIDENNTFSGISADYLKLVASKTGIKFTPQKSDNFKQMLQKVMDGTLKVGSTISFNTERAEKLLYTHPFFDVQKVIIINRERNHSINKISDLYGKTVAVETGYITIKKLKKLYPKINIEEVNSTLDALKKVSWNKADAYIGNQSVASWIARKNQLSNLITVADSGLGNGPQSFAVSKQAKGYEPLVGIINKALDSITSEQKLKIEQRWIGGTYRTQQQKPLDLNTQQKNWLLQHSDIRLGVDQGWQPLEFIDAKEQYQGLASEYMRYFTKRLGIQFKPPERMKWTQVLTGLKNKQLDVAPLLNNTSERSAYLNFTKPYLSFPNAVFNRHGETLLGGLSDLEGRKVGVTAGYSIVNLLRKDYPKIQQVEFASTQQGLKALSQGKVDAYIDVLAIGAYIIASNGISNVQVAASTPYKNYFSIGVRKDWPELISILNKAIDETPEHLKTEFLKKWLVVKFAQKTDYTLFYWALAIFIVIATLLILRAKEIAKVNETLQRANEAIVRASEFKSQFLANMSHEMRTPMNAIVGLSHLLSSTDLTTKQRDYTDKLQKSADIQMALINDILDFSKIEAGELKIEHKVFNLEDFITELSNLTSIRLNNKHIEYIYELDASIHQQLEGDPFRLNQILTNLISNAIKFTASGHILLKVSPIEQTLDTITLQFTVSDTGIGISKKDLKRLFNPFTQADSSTTRKYGGTGLGLSICKQLTELMNGSLSAHSILGKGSEFQVTLPFTISKKNAGKKILENPSVDLRNLKILLVEDNQLALQIIGELLASLSFQVTSVQSGQQALDICSLGDNTFDVILIDWKMPDMDGVETVKALKKITDPDNQSLYIMMTAYDKDILTSQLENTSLDALLVKPITPSNLFNAIISCRSAASKQNNSANTNKLSIAPLQGHILLAEDHEINQQVARELLEQMGLTVDICDNGLDVLEHLKSHTPDLILMDIQMPKLDGYQTTQKIRQNPLYKNIPIFAMTANAMFDDIQKSEQMGMQEHISKPVNPNQLYQTLSAYLPRASTIIDAQKQVPLTKQSTQLKHWPDKIKGLNIRLGIKQVGDNETLYQKLLKDFIHNYHDTSQNMQTWLQTGDLSTLTRVVHTLQGVSGNIGAMRLQQATSTLNKQLKHGNSVTEDAIEEFTLACDELFNSLKVLMNIEPTSIEIIETEHHNETDVDPQ